MKKILLFIIALSLIVSSLTSCGLIEALEGLFDFSSECEEHVDGNCDGKCDVCGADVACKEHADSDGDGKCDKCGADIPCESHVDWNRDGKCDKCGAEVPCTEHRDEDRDGKCDVCGTEVECEEHIDSDSDSVCDVCGKRFFTVLGEELYSRVGFEGYRNIEGGNLANVKNITLGEYEGRDGVVSFTTTPYSVNGADQEYSGGGLIVDLSDCFEGGKIGLDCNFSVKVSVYMPKPTGYRVGIVWGEEYEDIAYKSVWKNPYNWHWGWKTFTVTSEELRACDKCSDKEITGIFIAVNFANYAAAIESVTVTVEN